MIKRIVLLLFVSGTAFGQNAPTMEVLGQIIWENGNLEKEKINGTIDDIRFVPRKSGAFEVILPGDIDLAKIRLSGSWKVVFPVDGVLPIPKDLDFRMPIYVEKSDKASINYENIVKLISEIKEQVFEDSDFIKEQLTFLQKQRNQMGFHLQKQVDSLLILQTAIERDKRELQVERTLANKRNRQQTLNLLTGNIDHYISRALDLKDSFEKNASLVLKNRYTLDRVGSKVEAYTEAYEALNKSRKVISNQVSLYWENEVMALRTDELLDYALDHVHKEHSLVANNLVQDINRYWGREKGKKKKQIAEDIRQFVTRFHYALDNLKEKKEKIFQILKEG